MIGRPLALVVTHLAVGQLGGTVGEFVLTAEHPKALAFTAGEAYELSASVSYAAETYVGVTACEGIHERLLSLGRRKPAAYEHPPARRKACYTGDAGSERGWGCSAVAFGGPAGRHSPAYLIGRTVSKNNPEGERMNEQAEAISRAGLHAYRDSSRRWLVERFSDAGGYALWMATFTLADKATQGSIISDHDPDYLLKRAIRMCEDAGLSGVVLVEHGKNGGRVHAHGILLEVVDGARDAVRLRWTAEMGQTVWKPVTDLIGAVAYVTKSFGPESPVKWTKEVQHALGMEKRLPERVPAAGIQRPSLRRT